MRAWTIAVLLGLTSSALAEKVDWSQYLEPPGQHTAPPKQATPTPVPTKQVGKQKPAAKTAVKAAPKVDKRTPTPPRKKR